MTSPSAAHTGIAMTNAEAERHALADQLATVATSADFAAAAEAMAAHLVDTGHASWCPACGGSGEIVAAVHQRPGAHTSVTYADCTRCRGGRLNPHHGCTFTADPPCTCTQRCQVYRPQETPTP